MEIEMELAGYYYRVKMVIFVFLFANSLARLHISMTAAFCCCLLP